MKILDGYLEKTNIGFFKIPYIIFSYIFTELSTKNIRIPYIGGTDFVMSELIACLLLNP